MAYLLLNTETGSDLNVLKALKKVKGVEEAHNLWGVYDIIASVKADTLNELTIVITKRIKEIGKVTAKLAMITMDPRVAPIFFARSCLKRLIFT